MDLNKNSNWRHSTIAKIFYKKHIFIIFIWYALSIANTHSLSFSSLVIVMNRVKFINLIVLPYWPNQTLKWTAWHSLSRLANKVIFPHVVLSRLPPSAATCRKTTFSLRYTFQCPRRLLRARALTRHAALYFYVRHSYREFIL